MYYKIPFSITEPKKLTQYKEYFFDEYNYYLNEREKIREEIVFSINEKITSYSFKNWFRLISAKYSDRPLNCKGSTAHYPGGRFNIGKIKEGYFAPFPALYIGNGKETCVKEIYSDVKNFFNAERGASFFLVKGHIQSLLDITKKDSLNQFIKTIKKIKLSKSLEKRAKKLGLTNAGSVQNIKGLKNGIYDINWRRHPNIFNIPSLSQTFGQIAKNAGIEAVLYKSTKKHKTGLCIAIFPENFKNSESYVQLEDSPENIANTKMDSETYENFY